MERVISVAFLVLSTACGRVEPSPPAPPPPAMCGSAGRCTTAAPACFVSTIGGVHVEGGTPTISYECVPLDPCSDSPTCTCFQNAAWGLMNGSQPAYACGSVVFNCTINDAGIQLSCSTE